MTVQRSRTANLLGALALRVIDEVYDSIATRVGRGASAPAALVALARKHNGSIEYLRRVLGLSHPATVRLIDRLAKEGLVRRAHGHDARTVRPVLTVAGRKVARQITLARAAALERFIDQLDQASCAHATRILESLLKGAAMSKQDASNLCRLCDLGACNRSGACPVDEGLVESGKDCSDY